jgi:hypothetical protein
MPASTETCSICHRPAPGDVEAMIEAGWMPDYYIDDFQMPGPVCPDCCRRHLRIADDGELERIIPPPVGSDPDSPSPQT